MELSKPRPKTITKYVSNGTVESKLKVDLAAAMLELKNTDAKLINTAAKYRTSVNDYNKLMDDRNSLSATIEEQQQLVLRAKIMKASAWISIFIIAITLVVIIILAKHHRRSLLLETANTVSSANTRSLERIAQAESERQTAINNMRSLFSVETEKIRTESEYKVYKARAQEKRAKAWAKMYTKHTSGLTDIVIAAQQEEVDAAREEARNWARPIVQEAKRRIGTADDRAKDALSNEYNELSKLEQQIRSEAEHREYGRTQDHKQKMQTLTIKSDSLDERENALITREGLVQDFETKAHNSEVDAREANLKCAHYKGRYEESIPKIEELKTTISSYVNTVAQLQAGASSLAAELAEYKKNEATPKFPEKPIVPLYMPENMGYYPDGMTKPDNKAKGDALEWWVGQMYEQLGYTVDYRGFRLGPNDGGIDLVVHNNNHIIMIQCKNYQGAIERKDVSALAGDAKTVYQEYDQNLTMYKAFYTTNNRFHSSVSDVINANNIVLCTAENVPEVNGLHPGV